MILLVVFAFLAGVVTILSPCILPVLPIILSSSVDTTGKRRPLGVVVGFVLSFTFFTLFLSIIVRLSGIPAESLRFVSIFILIIFGLSLFVPKIQALMEKMFSNLSRFAPSGQTKHGFFGGLIIGLSLGLLWTPCVGPILASVISLAITGTVTFQAFIITLSYSLGTSIPMFIIMIGGQNILRRVPWILTNSAKIQKAFGVVMIITAIGIFFNLDRKFQTFILNTFPNYGVGLTKFEDNQMVKQKLKEINQKPMEETNIGKPMSELILPKGPSAPEIIPGGVWFNSKPLKLSELRGKVVVIDFWTYSCINCQRTMPYLRSWWEKYKDKGLVIIGVHSPEFEFEKNENNVARAISDFKLTYPIVQDNDFATWQAYDNHYWPAKYFIDKDGIIRFTHFGEGAYDESEEVIRKLLAETGSVIPTGFVSNPQYEVYSKTPETYLGYLRTQNLSSPEKINKDASGVYTSPQNLPNNYFAYEGVWNIMSEYASPAKSSKLHLNFESKEVFLVARSKGKTSSFKVYLDGELKYFGEDNHNGVVNVDSDRLYKLINLPTPGRHILKIEFEDGNAEVYAFTFG
ncbi:MAG: cytochrome c biogenesis protein DipZ [Patescibacteria group bacterium]